EPVPSSCTSRFHYGDRTAKNQATILVGYVPLHWLVPLSVLVNFLVGEVLSTLAYEIKQQGNFGARISRSLKICVSDFVRLLRQLKEYWCLMDSNSRVGDLGSGVGQGRPNKPVPPVPYDKGTGQAQPMELAGLVESSPSD
ncbi:hypothetical protein Tco_1506584, partial [Tanacetum coccineum]